MATPLLRTQDMITWVGVAPIRFAADLIGASTGPPGNFVTGLPVPSTVQYRMHADSKNSTEEGANLRLL